jgi:opacity protein-like surface antigen
MQKLLRTLSLATLLAVGATSTAMANNESGFYIQGNMGWTKTDVEKIDIDRLETTGTGFGGGGALGYKLSENFAIELDYTRYANTSYNYVNDNPVLNYKLAGSDSNQSIGLMAKAILPFDSGFNLFIKGGVAHVTHIQRTYTHPVLVPLLPIQNSSEKFQRVTGIFGAGAGYFISDEVELVAQVMSTTKSGPVPAMTSVTGGIAFHIS